MPTPTQIQHLVSGEAGYAKLIGGARIGTITSFRLVMSPTTGKPTLIASGVFLRYYIGQCVEVEAVVIPSVPPRRIGRKAPPKPRPIRVRGRIALHSATRLNIAEASYGIA